MYEARLPRAPVACTVTSEHLPAESDANRALKAPLRPATTDLARRGPPRTIARTRTASPGVEAGAVHDDRRAVHHRQPRFRAGAGSAGELAAGPRRSRTARAATERMPPIMPSLG